MGMGFGIEIGLQLISNIEGGGHEYPMNL
jgi:hypothetical protein